MARPCFKLEKIHPDPVAGVDDTLELTFPPLFVELLRDTPANPTVLRTVHARVRLTATGAGVSSDWIDLPPVTIPLPAIPVPSVLVLCQNAGFGGRVFVMVPGNLRRKAKAHN